MMNARRTRLVERGTLIQLLQAGLNLGELRFARQAAYAWLAAFPGDLEVRLLQARVIFAGEHPAQAIPVLEQVLQKDPEYLAAHEMHMRACRSLNPERARWAATHVYVLGGKAGPGMILPGGAALRAARRAFEEQRWDELSRLLPGALEQLPDSPLGAIMHWRLAEVRQEYAQAARLARDYHERWSEALIFRLALAVQEIEQGHEEEGVALLHRCAAADATGQVARRLWGEAHPYRALWPEHMLIPFDFPIPPAVAARMGWNQLGPGQIVAVRAVDAREPEPAADDLPVVENVQAEAADELPAHSAAHPAGGPSEAPARPAQTPPPAPDSNRPGAGGRARPASHGALKEVEAEFERLAKRLKQPALARQDGRYPVYVIFTTRQGLTSQYGLQTAAVFDQELRKLAGIIRQRPGWDAAVLYADDAASTAAFGLLPVPGDDPWKLKLLLSDLDGALAKRGEMIGAVLIVGGDSVVPFHRLPNPTDDADRFVPSDSPYGALDANYFVPDWPVGRLPGEPGPDCAYLLERIRRLQKYHSRAVEKARSNNGWLRWVRRWWLRRARPRRVHGMGYTAAVWRRSSMAVFRTIGAPHTLLTSPPEDSNSLAAEQLPLAGLGYYNLHGVEDSEAWYGQSDPAEPNSGPDYPVALTPKDLRRSTGAPRVIFSEACYGAHIFGKTENQSLALKFLGVGSLAVVGSTCISYGSISAPLIAADLLGSLFWKHLKAGRPAGEALVQARIDLAREMHRRQGYLDPEDQKALISFVLYGDPLAAYTGFQNESKGVRREKQPPQVKTVSEQEVVGAQAAPREVLQQAKTLAAGYLPGADLNGADGLDVRVRRQQGEPAQPGAKEGRLVLTVSKQVRVAHHIHRHYVRVTLDEGGRTVKLAISR